MVPRALRICFVAESLFQILCAVPLMLFPNGVLGMCGWTTIDPVATRLVGAALFGIAGASSRTPPVSRNVDAGRARDSDYRPARCAANKAAST